jgi:hypothetical protein
VESFEQDWDAKEPERAAHTAADSLTLAECAALFFKKVYEIF